MKAPAFAYAKPRTLDEAFALLAQHGEAARVLAGGQSLVPSLAMRLSAPGVLVDIGALPGLDAIRVDGDTLRIGALVTHARIGQSPEVRRHAPLLAEAAPHIAHVAIRNAGTLGGSIAMADPAAEWPACAVALDASIVLAGPKGERRVAATAFFRGLYDTALATGELVTAVEFPCATPQTRSAFLELVRRRGDYAIVGIAARAERKGTALVQLRLAFLGVGVKPVLAVNAMAAAEGKAADAKTVAAAQAALEKDLAPEADLYHAAATKLHLARVLTGRALAALAE